MDLVIKNGLILDGLGNKGFTGDLGIRSGRIETIDRSGKLEGSRLIDAAGLVVAPGFIDVHSHSDVVLLANPGEGAKVRQGVTTECLGNCGISLAPLSRPFLPLLQRYVAPLQGGLDLTWDWATMGEYLDRLKPSILNVATLVGHGTVRIATMGLERRRPTPGEMDSMKDLIAASMADGALGLSSGLIYPPGMFAETEELIALCKTVQARGGIYSSHIRGEGNTLLEALDEAIRIGEESGVSLLISHHKAGGKENWGKVHKTLALVEKARERGVDVHLDQYPYTAGSTMLGAIFPPWIQSVDLEQTLQELKNPQVRKRIKREMKEGIKGWENFVELAGWDGIVLAFCKRNKELEGKSILEIARERKQEPAETAFDIFVEEEGEAIIVGHAMSEDDVRTILAHPLVMVATDGIPTPGRPHPRAYGTYPRVLGKYVRKEGLLSIEEAIRKMTSLPASKLGLKDRGVIKAGNAADLVLLNPLKIDERSTYLDPFQTPSGIAWVIVNGAIVVEGERIVARSAGQILRRS